ncbi:MAG TPA: hypothetical protein VIL36_04190 [Acidimicrobiales bacterium]
MPWLRHRLVLPPAGPLSHLDWLRSFRPSVLEEDDGTLRMWYSAHDGERGRILEAVQDGSAAMWRRVALSIDGGGRQGVHSPSVVRTAGGYVMAYVDAGGTSARLHLATSEDGHRWEEQGPIGALDRQGQVDDGHAAHPSLVVTGENWWLFHTGHPGRNGADGDDGADAHDGADGDAAVGHDGAPDHRRAAIMAAVSTDGTTWDSVGTVLAPQGTEVALSAPAVLVRRRRFTMVYVSDDGDRTVIDLATSGDGIDWDRRGTTLAQGPQAGAEGGVHSPSTLRLRAGGLRLWYSTRTDADEADGCRMWSADFVTPPPSRTPADHTLPG